MNKQEKKEKKRKKLRLREHVGSPALDLLFGTDSFCFHWHNNGLIRPKVSAGSSGTAGCKVPGDSLVACIFTEDSECKLWRLGGE